MVDRNKLLRYRPDLPIERLQAYKQITAENAELKRQAGKWKVRSLINGQHHSATKYHEHFL